MKEIINSIFKIEHIQTAHLTSINSTPSGLANIVYTESFVLPISKSSARLSIESNRSAAGVSYDIALSANLNEEVADRNPGIYLVTIDDGSVYIIGSKDYPVRYQSSEELKEKSFRISYKSIRKPLKKAN